MPLPDPPASPPARLLSPAFSEALAYSAEVHATQTRKGTRVPYLSHLLAVSALVLEHGGSETEAIAALLHDAVEDGGGLPRLDEIRARFGDEVAQLVHACSDSAAENPAEKAPWRQRKQAHLAHLSSATPPVALITAADKLHNARCIVSNLAGLGDALWSRFQGGRAGTLWYYSSVLEALRDKAPAALVRDLELACAEMRALSSASNGILAGPDEG